MGHRFLMQYWDASNSGLLYGGLHIDAHAAALIKHRGEWLIMDFAYPKPLNLTRMDEQSRQLMLSFFEVHLYQMRETPPDHQNPRLNPEKWAELITCELVIREKVKVSRMIARRKFQRKELRKREIERTLKRGKRASKETEPKKKPRKKVINPGNISRSVSPTLKGRVLNQRTANARKAKVDKRI